MSPLLAFILAAWFRGNLHTHTLASDGDSAPEEVVRWYREHGYQFLVITDHDKITVVDGGGLLLIPGEEVTDRLPKKPLHVNAIGLREVVKPQHGATVVDNLQRNVDAVRAAGGLTIINHPNFGWAFGAEELKQIRNANFLEIASGHQLVNMYGPPSVEEMWDAMLTNGQRIWGVAVDDMHHLQSCDADAVKPGQAWIVVRAETLDEASILDAMKRGDFYASTGVELESYEATPVMTVKIKPQPGARYTTTFIGRGGRVLARTTDNPATYRVKGNEGYVRAKVSDSNGRSAWLQPWFSDTSLPRPRR